MHRFWAAIIISSLLLGVAVVAAIGLHAASTLAKGDQFAISHVTVIDVESGTRVADQTILVAGNKISKIGPAAHVAVPTGERNVDGRGKFLIPGMWDMHVHSFEHLGIDYSRGMEPYKLYIANGVTGVRDMGSSFLQLTIGKKRIESEHLVAPRIFASGPLLEGGQPPFGMALVSKYVPTPEVGRLAVESLQEAGVDFLKVHNGLTRESYFAIAEEAKRRHMIFAGHVPVDVTTAEASDAGQRSIELLASLTASCRVGGVPPAAGAPGASNPAQAIEIDRAKCDEALRHMVHNGTWLTPTLISSFPQTSANSSDDETHWRYLKAARRATCQPLPAEERAGARQVYEFNQRLVAMASKAGVRVLAGTDTVTCRQPGWALLEEVRYMVDAGLPPIDALRSATLNPAIYFNMTDSLGTVAQGKLADLVLLDGDPLSDIRNTSRIAAVVANGRLFDSDGRQKLLDDVLTNAAQP
jgi:imidazolonepropionase-like amidohydrolase